MSGSNRASTGEGQGYPRPSPACSSCPTTDVAQSITELTGTTEETFKKG